MHCSPSHNVSLRLIIPASIFMTLDELKRLILVKRLADQITLYLVTPCANEKLFLEFMLHAFGNGVLIEFFCYGDDIAGNCLARMDVHQGIYKVFVYFKAVYIEFPLSGKRGISGSEIIDGNINSQLLQFPVNAIYFLVVR